MKTIRLSNGFEVSISENVMDNMELVDALAEMTDDNPLEVSKVCSMVLKENKKALYDYIRTEDGRVPVSEVSNCIKEIFESFGEKGKN
ncbi:MAG: hypothetical protein MR010_05955 [Lachnospiraceae bacterium]|nr:hypothetical protein [Lachnospiraceae bacterium]